MNINPTTLVGGGLFLIGLSTLVMKVLDNGNGKRKKIYDRIEQERKDTEGKFVAMKLCEERSGNINKQLDEISKDVKLILTTGK